MSTNEQALPHSLEAERSVLGLILVAPDLMNQAMGAGATGLQPRDFYRSGHRHIFGAMQELFERGIAIDPVTVKDWLETRGQLAEAGGLEYLMQLMDGMPRLDHLGAYADLVREKSLQRSLFDAGQEIARAALAGGEASQALLNDAERRIFEAGGAHLTRDYKSLEEVGREMAEVILRVKRGEPMAAGVPTGFTRFDEMTTGLQPGQLWVLAARPGVGKTSFALTLALNAARRGHGVLLFSLEMTAHEIYSRLLCSEGDIDMHKFRASMLSPAEKDRMMETKDYIETLPLYIDDGAGTTHPLMRAKARRLAKDRKLDLVIVDYLQIMGSASKRTENRAIEIAEMSKGLKEMAKELRLPVLALSQLNRAADKRGADEPPLLSDLRESGAIEQDADLVAFLQRNTRAEPPECFKTEVHIAKQRNGPVGKLYLTFLASRTSFGEFAEPEVY